VTGYDRRRQVMVGLVLVVVYAGVAAAAAARSVPATILASLGATAVEYVVARRCADLERALDRLGAAVPTRLLWRDIALAIVALLAVGRTLTDALAIAGAVAALHTVAMAHGVLTAFVDRRSGLPIEVRGLDLPGVRIPRTAPRWATRFSRGDIGHLGLVFVSGLAVAVATGRIAPMVVSGIAAAVVGAIPALAMVPAFLGHLRLPDRKALVAEVGRQLAVYAPAVALHQAGAPSSLYQLTMWFEPVAATEQRCVVIVRNRAAFAALPPAPGPVLCIPDGSDLIELRLPTVRLALYPSNAGPNIHLLRETGMRHVFVGHGDSDKAASANPYSKVYDEVWVAGPAGRDRYLRADVGVRTEEIVEIGRPQLAGIRAGVPVSTSDGPLTVLYAPTWEGWGDDEHHTSLVASGERIITALLEASVPVRVIYKPHPLTGTRSAAAGAAHARVVSALAAHRDGRDHLVVTGAGPTLHECFNQAHLLIADVSSVVADWIASQKPYAVVNSRGVPETTFHAHYPSTAAAYLISADAGEVEKVLRIVREGPDPLTPARRDLARYLLGPAEPSSQERFASQIRRILGQRRATPRSVAQWRALNQARPSDDASSMVDIP
jgi:hypothetical protein